MIDNEIRETISVDSNIFDYVANYEESYYPPDIMDMLMASRRWWESVYDFRLFISQTAWEEISEGYEMHAQKRKELVSSMEVLENNHDIIAFATLLRELKIVKKSAEKDSLILANACYHKIDYLVTYNTKHFAKGEKRIYLIKLANKKGYLAPEVINPAEFLTKYIDAPKTFKVNDPRVDYRDDLSYNTITMKPLTEKDREAINKISLWPNLEGEDREEVLKILRRPITQEKLDNCPIMQESIRRSKRVEAKRRKDPAKLAAESLAKARALGMKIRKPGPPPPWIKELLDEYRKDTANKKVADRNTDYS